MCYGNIDGFLYTPSADLEPNTIVVSGGLVGVTRQFAPANQPSWVFFGGPRSHYGFTLAEAAGAAKDQGTAVYVTSEGVLTFTKSTNTLVGYLMTGIAATDKDIDVIIQ